MVRFPLSKTWNLIDDSESVMVPIPTPCMYVALYRGPPSW